MRKLSLSVLVVALFGGLAIASTRSASAQKSCEFLVPPSGGAYEIAIHPAYLTSLQFPGKLGSANTSDLRDYEIRRDGDSGLLVRPKAAKTEPANINVQSGTIRVSVGLRTVSDAKEACALVTFRATTEDEALQRRVEEAVAKRTAELEAQLATARRDQAALVRDQVDDTLADRAVARLEMHTLSAVDRNDDGVVVWAMRAVFFGDDLLVNVEIENRSGAPYRVSSLELLEGGKNRATSARLTSGASAGLVGTVAPGAKVRGVVVARNGASLAGKDLVLTVRSPDGKGAITVRRLGVR